MGCRGDRTAAAANGDRDCQLYEVDGSWLAVRAIE
jgi:hypothetical protein